MALLRLPFVSLKKQFDKKWAGTIAGKCEINGNIDSIQIKTRINDQFQNRDPNEIPTVGGPMGSSNQQKKLGATKTTGIPEAVGSISGS